MISELSQYEDFKDLIKGKFLGKGVHREVHVFKPDSTLVIKSSLEEPTGNIVENEIWWMVKDTELAKWFAPCESISTCGMFMLQKRVENRPKKEYPKYIPSFFTDTKYSNFGWIDNQFVACDYVGCFVTSMVHKWNGKMIKADWWE